jgi:hypothetical protein
MLISFRNTLTDTQSSTVSLPSASLTRQPYVS